MNNGGPTSNTNYPNRDDYYASPLRSTDPRVSPRAPGRPDTDEGADSGDLSPTGARGAPVPPVQRGRAPGVAKGNYFPEPTAKTLNYGTPDKVFESPNNNFGPGSGNESSDWLTNSIVTQPTYNPNKYEEGLLHTTQRNSVLPETHRMTPEMHRVADGAENPNTDSALGLDSESITGSSVDILNQITTVLQGMNLNNESDDLKSALLELLKMIRSNDRQLIGDKLTQLVPEVLQQLKHKEGTIRCLAARALREVAQSQPQAYRHDLKSFILPLLETECDTQKEVAKTAEECCTLVSEVIPAAELLPIVSPLVGESPYPVNLSAIKMLNVIADQCTKDPMTRHVDVTVRNLLKAYDHDESSVRKAAVFCLVSVHNLVGESIVQPYFADLAGSKMKLLLLYIRRRQTASV